MQRCAVLIALVTTVTFSVAGEEIKPPEIKVPKITKSAPLIDGKLDEEVWKEALISDEFKQNFGQKPAGKARLLVARDDQKLYLALECFETAEYLKALKTEVSERDGDGIWDDDEIELFIDPTHKRESYYQLIINAKGTSWDCFCPSVRDPDKTWEPKYEVKTSVGADRWTVELALPFAAFDRTPKHEADWAFNACHMRAGANEFIYWSPVHDDSAHSPAKFGKLTGLPARGPLPAAEGEKK